MLELTDGQRERVHELQAISDEAEADGPEGLDARRRLRLAMRQSAPEVIARCADTTLTYRGMLADTAAGGDPLRKEAITERARLIAGELAGDSPTPLEALLSDRVASLWVLVELQEALVAGWYKRGNESRVSPGFMLQMVRLQESAHRRYLQAIKTLAQVQKLRGPQRLQVNIGGQHVNVS